MNHGCGGTEGPLPNPSDLVVHALAAAPTASACFPMSSWYKTSYQGG